jgi:hypothetical protein
MAKRRKPSGPSPAPVRGECAYRIVLESYPDGLLVIGHQGAVQFFNRAASELLGMSLRPGLSLQDQTGWCQSLRKLPQAPNGTRVIRVRRAAGKRERVLEVRTTPTRWEGETSLLVCLHEAPSRSQSDGKRWSPLVSVYRGLTASAPVCTHCGSRRIERDGAGGRLARVAGLVGHHCQDCHTVFHLPRRLAPVREVPAEEPSPVEATAEEPLKVEGASEPVTPDALRALDRLLEALPKAEPLPKTEA